MDTLSRDSNSSGSILPLVGVIAGALGLILAVFALVKQTSIKKEIEDAKTELSAKVTSVESEMRTSVTNNEAANKRLQDAVQNALNQVGEQIGAMRGQITKLEEAQKARAAAPAGKAGAAGPAATGVLNADGTYTIGPGDTLAKIARKFAVKMDSLEAENPGLDPTRLKIGQKIRVPKK